MLYDSGLPSSAIGGVSGHYGVPPLAWATTSSGPELTVIVSCKNLRRRNLDVRRGCGYIMLLIRAPK